MGKQTSVGDWHKTGIKQMLTIKLALLPISSILNSGICIEYTVVELLIGMAAT